jgi:ubiquinone/menaquinone biosynthesis C-methylase UbiE
MEPTGRPLRILDLGCGTGIELAPVFERFPDAVVTGIDVSPGMLQRLKDKYPREKGQIRLVCASYMDVDLGERCYDYVISVMTAHHFLPEEKLGLYKRIRAALTKGGAYIEADWMVPPEKMQQHLAEFYAKRASLDASGLLGLHHIDIPFTVELQQQILREAGFSTVTVAFSDREDVTLIAR